MKEKWFRVHWAEVTGARSVLACLEDPPLRSLGDSVGVKCPCESFTVERVGTTFTLRVKAIDSNLRVDQLQSAVRIDAQPAEIACLGQ